VTRPIHSPVDAEQIANTLKPLVSKEAALVSYAGTNTIILTDSASNITRILSILEAIDVESFKEELALIRLQYADAAVVADQLSQLFGAEVVSSARGQSGAARVRARAGGAQAQQAPTPDSVRRGQVRTSPTSAQPLVALASRLTLEEMRDFIRKLDPRWKVAPHPGHTRSTTPKSWPTR
jgi:type II secretory pathway component GspD/PulD (secretin)